MTNRMQVLSIAALAGFTAVADVISVKSGDSLEAAVVKARSSANRPVTIELGDGVYRLERTLVLTAADNGLTIRAKRGAKPAIDAGVTVKGFKPYRDGISYADVSSVPFLSQPFVPYGGCGVSNRVPRIEALYRDGKLLMPAREPNEGFFKADEIVDSPNFVFRSKSLDAAKFKDRDDIYTTCYWRYLWADGSFGLRSDGTNWHLEAEVWGCEYSYHTLMKDFPFFAWNALEFLDREDEWVLDRKAKRIYVKGDAKAEYVLAGLDGAMIELKGADDVTLEGIVFRHARGNAVKACDSRGFTFRGNTVERIGFTGLSLVNMTYANILGNVFRTFGFKAVTLSGGDRKTLKESGNVFADNDVTDTGRAIRTYSHAVAVSGCGTSVLRNYFHDLPSSSIAVSGNEHLIASNITERAVLESDDQGGVDSFGSPFFRGTKIIHNVWRDIGGTSTGLAGTCGKAGVRFDDMVSGMYVYGNRFDNCSEGIFGGVQIHAGRDNTVVNNIFTRCRYAVSITPWSKKRWSEEKWYPNTPYKEEVDPFCAVWKAKYGDLGYLRDYPQTNRVERNLVIGAEKTVKSWGEGLECVIDRDNLILDKGTEADAAKIRWFEPLPPESELGPRKDVSR